MGVQRDTGCDGAGLSMRCGRDTAAPSPERYAEHPALRVGGGCEAVAGGRGRAEERDAAAVGELVGGRGSAR